MSERGLSAAATPKCAASDPDQLRSAREDIKELLKTNFCHPILVLFCIPLSFALFVVLSLAGSNALFVGVERRRRCVLEVRVISLITSPKCLLELVQIGIGNWCLNPQLNCSFQPVFELKMLLSASKWCRS